MKGIHSLFQDKLKQINSPDLITSGGSYINQQRGEGHHYYKLESDEYYHQYEDVPIMGALARKNDYLFKQPKNYNIFTGIQLPEDTRKRDSFFDVYSQYITPSDDYKRGGPDYVQATFEDFASGPNDFTKNDPSKKLQLEVYELQQKLMKQGLPKDVIKSLLLERLLQETRKVQEEKEMIDKNGKKDGLDASHLASIAQSTTNTNALLQSLIKTVMEGKFVKIPKEQTLAETLGKAQGARGVNYTQPTVPFGNTGGTQTAQQQFIEKGIINPGDGAAAPQRSPDGAAAPLRTPLPEDLEGGAGASGGTAFAAPTNIPTVAQGQMKGVFKIGGNYFMRNSSGKVDFTPSFEDTFIKSFDEQGRALKKLTGSFYYIKDMPKSISKYIPQWITAGRTRKQMKELLITKAVE